MVARRRPPRGGGETAEPRRRRRHPGSEDGDVMTQAVQQVSRPAWYALERGGWRDYVTLLHPPYTAWHLSYVVVGAHALDELNGRPLRTKIPDRVLVALAGVSIVGACAIGVVGAVAFKAWLALLIPIGLFLVLAYNLELAGGRFHSDVWFGLAWGGFPVLNGYAAVAGEVRGVTALAAVLAVLLSLAQRVLSKHVRYVRRQVIAVRGVLELVDGSKEALDGRRLTAPAEAGLRLLSLGTVALAATLVAFRI